MRVDVINRIIVVVRILFVYWKVNNTRICTIKNKSFIYPAYTYLYTGRRRRGGGSPKKAPIFVDDSNLLSRVPSFTKEQCPWGTCWLDTCKKYYFRRFSRAKIDTNNIKIIVLVVVEIYLLGAPSLNIDTVSLRRTGSWSNSKIHSPHAIAFFDALLQLQLQFRIICVHGFLRKIWWCIGRLLRKEHLSRFRMIWV